MPGVQDKFPSRIRSSTTDQVMSLNKTMDGQARLLLYFDGRVDERRLRNALRSTFDAEPLLAYRFVDNVRRPYWQRVEEKDWSDWFDVVEGEAWCDDFERFMIEPIFPEDAPQVRARLYRSQDDILCLRSNHMALDGGGAIQFLGLLSTIYRELAKDPSYRPSVNPGRKGPRDVLKAAGLVPAIRALPLGRMPASEWGIERTTDDLSSQKFYIRQVGTEDLVSIRNYAREHKVTLNDVLLTAFIRSLFVNLEPPKGRPLRIEVPVNLRRHLPDNGSSIGNLSAVYFLAIERKDESFEDTLREVHRMIEFGKNNRTELAQMLLLELVMAPGKFFLSSLMELADFEIAHPVLSNLGVIDPGSVDFGGTLVKDVQLIGPTLHPPNIGLSISTYRDIMTVSLNVCASAVDIKRVERILDMFLDSLPSRTGRTMDR